MHDDTLAAAKALAQSIIDHGETQEANQYGEMVEHLADLIEDGEFDREEGEYPSFFMRGVQGVDRGVSGCIIKT